MPKTSKQKDGSGGGYIKCYKCEIFGFGRESGMRDKWLEATRDVQRLYNWLWREWICWHHNNDSGRKLAESLAANKAWETGGKVGVRPKWTVEAIPSGANGLDPRASLRNAGISLYKRSAAAFPDLSTTTVSLVLQRWRGDVMSKKAANGNLPGWAAILLGNQAVPSFNHPQPIPIKAVETKIESVNGKLFITFRGVRLADRKGAGNTPAERCELMLNRRKTASFRDAVQKMLSGEWKLKGSSIEYRKGKWFACLACEIPRPVGTPLHADRVIWVVPGRKWPLRIITIDENGRRTNRPLCDRWGVFSGSHIKVQRESILRERGDRRQHYRWAGSAQKGHGQKRALALLQPLSDRWKELTKRTNHAVSREIVNQALRGRVGRIVYWQPKESKRDSRFLVTVGNRPGSGMGWDFFQLGTLLANKCQEAGIEFSKQEAKVASAAKIRKAKPATGRVSGVRKSDESGSRVRAGRKATRMR